MTTKKSLAKKKITKKAALVKKAVLPVLVLKSVGADMKSYGDFLWPKAGEVLAPDWRPTKECGAGLHGWLWAVGDFSLQRSESDAKWLVIEVDPETLIDLSGKVKFPKGNVIFCGTFAEAYFLVRKEAIKRFTFGGPSTTGNYAHSSTTGDSAHSSTTGNYAHSSTTGYYAHSSTTGNSAHSSTTGDYAHSSTTGNSAHSSTTGDYAHSSTTGDSAHSSTTGYYAHSSTTGNYAHSSTTGYYAHSSTTGNSAHSSTTGDSAIAASLGRSGRVKAGKSGTLVIAWWDDEAKRNRVAVGYPGENGIKADRWYTVDDHGKFVEID